MRVDYIIVLPLFIVCCFMFVVFFYNFCLFAKLSSNKNEIFPDKISTLLRRDNAFIVRNVKSRWDDKKKFFLALWMICFGFDRIFEWAIEINVNVGRLWLTKLTLHEENGEEKSRFRANQEFSNFKTGKFEIF